MRLKGDENSFKKLFSIFEFTFNLCYFSKSIFLRFSPSPGQIDLFEAVCFAWTFAFFFHTALRRTKSSVLPGRLLLHKVDGCPGGEAIRFVGNDWVSKTHKAMEKKYFSQTLNFYVNAYA
jgi:hypothetical protein